MKGGGRWLTKWLYQVFCFPFPSNQKSKRSPIAGYMACKWTSNSSLMEYRKTACYFVPQKHEPDFFFSIYFSKHFLTSFRSINQPWFNVIRMTWLKDAHQHVEHLNIDISDNKFFIIELINTHDYPGYTKFPKEITPESSNPPGVIPKNVATNKSATPWK